MDDKQLNEGCTLCISWFSEWFIKVIGSYWVLCSSCPCTCSGRSITSPKTKPVSLVFAFFFPDTATTDHRTAFYSQDTCIFFLVSFYIWITKIKFSLSSVTRQPKKCHVLYLIMYVTEVQQPTQFT